MYTQMLLQVSEECKTRQGRFDAVGSQLVHGAETRQTLLKRGYDTLDATQQAALQYEAKALAMLPTLE